MASDYASEDDKNAIHFDTLLAQSLTELDSVSGTLWTERGEGDPGITLMEALTWTSADLGYRHTLPLADLLTPPDNEAQGEGRDIFPAGFGPIGVLSCKPVTLEDYRRAALDMVLNDLDECKTSPPTTFLFRDVTFARVETDTKLAYNYAYDRVEGQFRFAPDSNHTGKDADITLPRTGDYAVSVVMEPAVTQARLKDAALLHLSQYLRENRQMGEGFLPPAAPETLPLPVTLDLTLEDDAGAEDIRRIFTAVWHRVTRALSPAAERRRWQGEPVDEWYDGPVMRYGKIDSLPGAPQKNTAGKPVLSLHGVTRDIYAIPGVKFVDLLEFDANNIWEYTGTAGTVYLAWGENVTTAISGTKAGNIVFRKRGRALELKDYIRVDALSPLTPVLTGPPKPVLTGRYRKLSNHLLAGPLLPEKWHSADATENPLTGWPGLMLPCEQWRTLQQGRLVALRHTLGFMRLSASPQTSIGAALAGDRAEELNWYAGLGDALSASDGVFNGDRESARGFYNAALAGGREHELASLDYLLQYFGARREPRSLYGKPADFTTGNQMLDYLQTQQGYLQWQPEISAQRASLQVDDISSLHLRIAAHLGVGAPLFYLKKTSPKDNAPDMNELPFYLVDNRQLLPTAPPANVGDTIASSFSLLLDDKALRVTLTFGANQAPALAPGQFVDLILKNNTGGVKNYYTYLLIRGVEVNGNDTVLHLSVTDDGRLKSFYDQYASHGSDTLTLRFSDRWLTSTSWAPKKLSISGKMVTLSLRAALTPAERSAGKNASDIKTALLALPPALKAECELRFFTYTTRGYEKLKQGEIPKLVTRAAPTVIATVKSIDPVARTFVAEISKEEWPTEEDIECEIVNDANNEVFSSTVSVVFKEELACDSEGMFNQARLDWISQVVQEELPLSIEAHICYLNKDDFANFGKTYNTWMNNGNSLQMGESFGMIEALSLGRRPLDLLKGIGFMAIAANDPNPNAQYADRETEGVFFVNN